MNYLDEAITKSLDEFMEYYKVVDTENIYSIGIEFVPIFRVKQWEEYNNKDKEIKRLHSIIKEVKEYIRSKSIKFTMAYVEDNGRIDLSRSDYRIDKLTSKQVKELLEILDKENI